MKCDSPLVSVVVITYNSSSFVLDTLKSIYDQSYRNIELIISDDSSNDNTIELCVDWINLNQSRFVKTELLTSNINTGVAANCNRGYRAANGIWIKCIAGDDLLLPDCIENYVNFVERNHNIEICASKARCFSISKDNRCIEGKIIPVMENRQIYKKNAEEQLKILLQGNQIVTPTLFVKKETTNKFPFKEIYRYMEDIPFLIDLTMNNIQIHFMDKITVMYRLSDKSLSQTQEHFFPSRMFESKTIYFINEKKYILNKYLPEAVRKEQKRLILWGITDLILNNNAKPLYNRIIYKLLEKLL